MTTTTFPPHSAEHWLERGHRCAAGGTAEDLREALACYDRARASITGNTADPAALHLLGLAWMNRGNILQQSPAAADLTAAINAYDAALAAFASILARSGVANSAATARLNRGYAQQRAGNTAAALTDFNHAWHELDALAAAGDPAAPRNAAGAAINLAHLRLAADAPAAEILPLLADARRHLGELPATDAIAATLCLEAARLELLARLPDLANDTLAAFTDLIESALGLAADWHHRDHPTADELAAQLFRLGATAYARLQPHFLLEFLRDALDPATGPAPFAALPRFHRIAAESLAALRADAARPRLLRADDPAAAAWAALARDLAQPQPWLHPAA